MNRIKKILLKSLSAVMAIVLCLGFTGCFFFEKSEAEKEQEFISLLGGVSETFKGAISNETYDTAEKAAEAYVEEQIVGEKEVLVVNTKSKGELSQAQINALELSQAVKEGLVSVEEMEVEYSTSKISYSSTNNENNKVKVYVIKYENNWKYYTPAPVTGETISKDYYNSVFDFKKYENCTLSITVEVELNMMFFINSKTTITQLIKHDGNKIYMEQTTTVTELGTTEKEVIHLYIEKVGDSQVCYTRNTATNMKWISAELYQVGFNSVEELTPFYDSYLDYTYFTKTDYGFRMSDENARQYIRESLEMEGIGNNVVLGENLNMDMFVKYYVSNGVLSGMREDASFTLTMEESGEEFKTDAKIFGETICSNYGTTVVTRPF